MNPVTLNLMPDGAAGSPPSDAALGAGGNVPAAEHADIFRTALAQRIVASAAAPPRASAALPNAVTRAQLALEAQIAKRLDGGASQADIIASLAAQLAATVAPHVAAGGAEAQSKLRAVFAAALAPPGDGEPAQLSLAQRVRQLAQRYMKLEAVARAITGHPPDGTVAGQQKYVAGTLLDARRAKDIPAPAAPIATNAPDAASAGSAASAGASETAGPTAFAQSTSTPAANAAPVTALAPHLPAAAAARLVVAAPPAPGSGDGRRVRLDALPAIGTGGDTLLGRILARAANAAETRSAAAAPQPAPTTAGPAAPGTGTAGAAADGALTAFVKAFEAALKPDSESVAPAVPVAASSVAASPHPDPSPAATAVFGPAAPVAERAAAATGPATPAALPPIDHSSIADQVLRGALLRNVGQSSEMRLSLVPEALGDVGVKLVVEAGNVSAHVVAETSEVRDALVAAAPQLAKSLAESGLKLQSFNVTLSGDGFAGFGQQQQPSSDAQRQHRAPQFDDAEAVDETPLEAIPTFGPPTLVRSAAGDLNHLA